MVENNVLKMAVIPTHSYWHVDKKCVLEEPNQRSENFYKLYTNKLIILQSVLKMSYGMSHK